MNHDEAVEHATRVLAAFGLTVSSLPELGEKTADLRANDDLGRNFLFEVKVKSHNSEMWGRIQQDLLTDDVTDSEETLHRRDAIHNVFEHASTQLEATAKSECDFRIVWASFDGFDADLRWNQVLATFYGIVYTLPRQSTVSDADHCYYFDHNSAFSCPNIDALIICDGKHLQFCLNEFSPRYEAIKETRIVRELDLHGGVIDPPTLAKKGIAFVLRSNVSRRNECDVLKALREQEGIEFSPIRIKRHAAYASIRPRS